MKEITIEIAEVKPLSDTFTIPNDLTTEESAFLDLVKQRMLRRLTDRQKFIFTYCFELRHNLSDAAKVLQIHETNVNRQIKQIREILAPFRETL